MGRLNCCTKLTKTKAITQDVVRAITHIVLTTSWPLLHLELSYTSNVQSYVNKHIRWMFYCFND